MNATADKILGLTVEAQIAARAFLDALARVADAVPVDDEFAGACKVAAGLAKEIAPRVEWLGGVERQVAEVLRPKGPMVTVKRHRRHSDEAATFELEFVRKTPTQVVLRGLGLGGVEYHYKLADGFEAKRDRLSSYWTRIENVDAVRAIDWKAPKPSKAAA